MNKLQLLPPPFTIKNAELKLWRAIMGGFLPFSFLILNCISALAQANPNPPERLTYQGFLADGTGTALGTNAPKNYDVVFRLWDDASATAPANRLWTEQQTVTVDKGFFSVLLGEGTQVTSPATEPHGALSTLFTNATASDRFVEMTVKGIGAAGADVKILPRLRLLTSPYAYLATKAISANSASSVDGSAVTGTVLDARLSPNVALLNRNSQAFTGNNTFAGNVGIGTTNPAAKLHVAGSGWFGVDGNALPSAAGVGVRVYYDNQISSGVVNCHDYANNVPKNLALGITGGNVGIGTTAPSNKLTVSGNADFTGNVGIGTTSPGERLTIADVSGYNSGLKLTGSGASFGVGMAIENTSPGGRKYVLTSTSANANTGAGAFGINDENGGGYRFVINSNGNVGIGTTTPTKAKMEINGTAGNYTIAAGSTAKNYTSSTINTLPANTYGSASLYASGDVIANVFIAFSDERIKRIEGRSDAARDLAVLAGIQVTDYTYIDTISKGTGKQKKVIAQQVEKVYPQAVSRSTDVVPDIYQKAEFKDGWVKLATSLKVGERVRLIGEKKEGIHEVLEVRDGAFRTAFQPATNEVFVYGREVKDFRSVDYEAISMLNVSATQELARRLEKVEARESHVAELERKAGRVETLEQEVADLKKLVAQLAADSKSAKLAAQATKQTHAAANATAEKVFTTASLVR